jgi:Tfp pilus assembly protein FimT
MTEPRAAEGYSLAELLAVLGCIAALVITAAPNVRHLQKEWTLWGSARALEASLQWGRMHAISSNAPIIFEIDAGRQKFYWTDPQSGAPYTGTIRQVSNSVRIASCPKRPLRFYQHGNAAPAGTYVIEGDTGSYSVVVSPGGKIRIQRN